MPVSAGTPIIGVRAELFLSEAIPGQVEGITEAAAAPELWPIRLGMRLLQEARDAESPHTVHLDSVSPRPVSPLLWSLGQAAELQYVPAKRLVAERLQELKQFHQQHVEGSSVAGALVNLTAFVSAVASASSRGVEVRPGERALVPLIDLVGPPEAPALEAVVLGRLPPPPSCELRVEDGLAMLVAARDIGPGEALTRDVGLDAEELLLRYGAPTCGNPRNDVTVWAGVSKKNANPWQVKEICKAVDVEPGEQEGSYVATCQVRRAKSYTGVVDEDLLYCARVLACEKKEKFYGEGPWADAEPVRQRQGLEGLNATGREAALSIMIGAVRGAQAAMPTSLDEDSQLLQLLSGPENRNRLVATLYRMEKKQILDDVLRVLGKALNREMERRDKRRRDASLPTAVTGRKRAVGQGFG